MENLQLFLERPLPSLHPTHDGIALSHGRQRCSGKFVETLIGNKDR
jgi:hypothetical protein